MPELPEVFTIAKVLDQNISGFKIDKVRVNKGFSVKPSEDIFISKLESNTLESITSYAKNIVFKLTDGMFMIVHLAMTGQMIFKKLGDRPSPWERVLFTLSKKGKSLNLTYNDMRMFGKLEVMTAEDYVKLTQKYGLNPLDTQTSPSSFHKKIYSKKTNIKNALLDQKIVAGAGNIYANDALFMSGINPKRITQSLDTKETANLLKNLRQILNEGIEHGGSTLDDEMFVDPFGRKGNHQKYFRIYGKKICHKCGNRVIFKS